jgi:hypothetical protein
MQEQPGLRPLNNITHWQKTFVSHSSHMITGAYMAGIVSKNENKLQTPIQAFHCFLFNEQHSMNLHK